MKLLHVGKYLPPVTGGMETSVLQLCEGLSLENSVNVSCLVSNTKPKTIREKLGDVSVVRAARFGSVASTPVCPTFRSEGAKTPADILHFHLPNPLATLSFSGFNKPYVVTYHCDIVRYKNLLSFYKPFMVKFLKRASKVIVTSKELLESSPVLQEVKENCQIIPLGISSIHLEPDGRRVEIEKKLVEQYGEKIVLFVGRLVSYKGLEDLIDSMRAVNGHLVIVGTGPLRGALEERVRKSELDRKVSFADYVPDEEIGAYYRAARVVALTSKNESEAFGMCLIEALSCGKPLLTTKLNTGVSSVNLDGVTGLQVAVGDVKAIAEKLNLILSDSVLAEKFGNAGLEHFRKNFKLSSVVQSHLKLYEQVLSCTSSI